MAKQKADMANKEKEAAIFKVNSLQKEVSSSKMQSFPVLRILIGSGFNVVPGFEFAIRFRIQEGKMTHKN